MMTNIEFSKYMKDNHLTLGSAESFTGGLFAREITRVPGASKFFKGAVVSYATEIKTSVLKVPEQLVKEFGVVSKECALEMAKRAKDLLNVDVAVSFTGNAGPDTMEDKPAGEIYIGVSYKNKIEAYKYNLEGSRNEVQSQAVELSYSLIKQIIEK